MQSLCQSLIKPFMDLDIMVKEVYKRWKSLEISAGATGFLLKFYLPKDKGFLEIVFTNWPCGGLEMETRLYFETER